MKARVAVVTTVLALACGDPVDPIENAPDPGFVSVSVSFADQGVGALWMTISGAGRVVDSVRTTGLTVFGNTASASEQRLIVAGPIVTGEVVRFWMPDRNELASYRATVNEAAAASSYEQLPATGFTTSLTPVAE